MPVMLFGNDFWDKMIDLQGLADFGTISHSDLDLCYRTDTVDDAFKYLTKQLTDLYLEEAPATF
jgi:predicted Rossmann-fold nucleotide-binding protein